MKRVSALLFVMALTVGVALPASAATVADFQGVWTSVDAADGSNQVMLIRPGSSSDVRVVLFDTRTLSSTCPSTGPAIARGPGTINGNDLQVDFTVRCFDGTAPFPVSVTFTLQSDGTLTDTGSPGTVWSRVFP